MNFSDKVSLIWNIAELLRGDYKQSDYGKVILPFTVLRRLDCALEDTKDKVLDNYKNMAEPLTTVQQRMLERASGSKFYNTSTFTMRSMRDFPGMLGDNIKQYVQGFSENAREIIRYFDFEAQINKLQEGNILFNVLEEMLKIDLHPNLVSNIEMGYIFEELIRRFSEQSNETAGEHFTPREVIQLMVNVLFEADAAALTGEKVVRKIYDPACGTGGMLAVAYEYLRKLNPSMNVEVFGQELNGESYAICKSDMLLKGLNVSNIKLGNSFTQDGLENEEFHYFLSNPPFGVDWKKTQKDITDEHQKQGFNGRFGAGLPRVSDGSLLFLQHMISKMKPGEGRIAIVLNGSPLFTGGAASGESEIRRWIIENDLLEAIIALPTDLFYNTGISTYIWVLSNHKQADRRGKVQLINAVDKYQKMRKSLGSKRNELGEEHINEIIKLYSYFAEGEDCKVFDNEDFGYRRITIERPLRLNFRASLDRIERLSSQTSFAKLGEGEKEQIKAVLKEMDADKLYLNRDEFEKALKKSFKQKMLTIKPPIFKALLSALAERDETADICLDGKGNKEADSELRDFESVPLKQDIYDYFNTEVLPHVEDAWINMDVRDDKDGGVGKVGYEIPFTRHFYKYQELRSAQEINNEIKTLENEILDLIKGVLS
ncbi:class I SAM-dependent DNA methyltransferase [Paenibacillus sp. FSL K6-3166]|uniref:type I restriction-modification system subunit M n=1 Tax=unclassified Paenibacillus TaxID=185978 RepID=UPI000BA10D64|nr:class I SAM-dependent DNA methyltransferase [Paenibacillus sp. VTT E-133291]MBY3618626.1 SAM-dependent DNA methyltransferase [Acinetobacter sp. CUI P1]OZQ97252.1 restriction endonuclease subunit M [Paenibacillus sp. VTT E-133291]